MDPANEGSAFRLLLGIQLQESRLPDRISVIEALNLYASLYPEPHDPDDLLERLGMVEQRNTYFATLRENEIGIFKGTGMSWQDLSVAAMLDQKTTQSEPVRPGGAIRPS